MKAMYHCQFEVSVKSQKYEVLYTKLNCINHSVIGKSLLQMHLYDPTERSSFCQLLKTSASFGRTRSI